MVLFTVLFLFFFRDFADDAECNGYGTENCYIFPFCYIDNGKCVQDNCAFDETQRCNNSSDNCTAFIYHSNYDTTDPHKIQEVAGCVNKNNKNPNICLGVYPYDDPNDKNTYNASICNSLAGCVVMDGDPAWKGLEHLCVKGDSCAKYGTAYCSLFSYCLIKNGTCSEDPCYFHDPNRDNDYCEGNDCVPYIAYENSHDPRVIGDVIRCRSADNSDPNVCMGIYPYNSEGVYDASICGLESGCVAFDGDPSWGYWSHMCKKVQGGGGGDDGGEPKKKSKGWVAAIVVPLLLVAIIAVVVVVVYLWRKKSMSYRSMEK